MNVENATGALYGRVRWFENQFNQKHSNQDGESDLNFHLANPAYGLL